MAKLNVKLVEHTPNPEKVIASAAKLCYSGSSVDELFEKQTPEAVDKFLNKLVSIGHESPIEHVSFTFAIEGVSRSLSHQLVRHRIASYSQQSQRYVKLGKFEYIVPPAIEEIESAKSLFINHMISSQMVYDNLIDKLIRAKTGKWVRANTEPKIEADGTKVWCEDVPKAVRQQAEKEAIEDARYVFPNACETKVMVTMNARTLYNFFKHRCCDRAQWEIRDLATAMLKEVKNVAPTLFKTCGPSCMGGSCPEGSMSCGKLKEKKEYFSKL